MIEGLPEYPSVDLIRRGNAGIGIYGDMVEDLPQSVSTTEGIQYCIDTRTCRICARRRVDSAPVLGLRRSDGPPVRGDLVFPTNYPGRVFGCNPQCKSQGLHALGRAQTHGHGSDWCSSVLLRAGGDGPQAMRFRVTVIGTTVRRRNAL